MQWLVVITSEAERTTPFAVRLGTMKAPAALWIPDRCVESPSATLARYSAVLLPSLPLPILARLATLLWDTPLTELVGAALLEGKRVAFFPGSLRRPGIPPPPPGIAMLVDLYLQRLESFGMEAAGEEAWWEELVTPKGGPAEFAAPVSGNGRGRTVITQEEIREWQAKGRRTVHLGREPIVTPLARDLARDLGIELVEGGPGP